MKKLLITLFLISIITGIFGSSAVFADPDDFFVGSIKVYVVEPVSRWNNNDGQPYHYALLDIALDSAIYFPGIDSIVHTFTWNGTVAGYGDVTQDNIMVIGAVCNGASMTSYSDPPTGNPFDAYVVEACAASDGYNSWPNVSNGSFTHTVLLEDGTQTWCPNCPVVADSLHYIYENSGLPMFYMSLVANKNPDAYNRYFIEYNRYGDPSIYFDSGDMVFIGSEHNLSEYESYITDCGTREVPPMQFDVEMTWLGGGSIRIDLKLVYGKTPTAVDDKDQSALPDNFALGQNYPNPFNPNTTISYTVANRSRVELTVYNIIGQEIRTLVDEVKPAGSYTVEWDGNDAAGKQVGSGIYFYSLKAGDFSETRKMTLLK